MATFDRPDTSYNQSAIVTIALRALILYRRRRSINHLLTYLLLASVLR